jgi:hypothetical protein
MGYGRPADPVALFRVGGGGGGRRAPRMRNKATGPGKTQPGKLQERLQNSLAVLHRGAGGGPQAVLAVTRLHSCASS